MRISDYFQKASKKERSEKKKNEIEREKCEECGECIICFDSMQNMLIVNCNFCKQELHYNCWKNWEDTKKVAGRYTIKVKCIFCNREFNGGKRKKYA